MSRIRMALSATDNFGTGETTDLAGTLERGVRMAAEHDERAVIHDGIDPKAVEAARKGELPEPAPGMAGESDTSEPSRAEVLALRPDLADSVAGTPTEGHAHATGGDEPPHVRGNREKLEGAPPPGGRATEEHKDGV